MKGQRMELRGRTILIVEDNSDDRFFMGKALERVAPGIVAEYVVSGEEALSYLKGQGNYADRIHFPYPAFVVTDLEMPQGNGFCVLRELQATPGSTFVPVMMLSSSEDPADIRRAYALGATSYCRKPSGRAALCAVLNAFFNGYVSEAAGSTEGDGRMLCV
jgi:CheY-like chemotaxis protein